MGVKCLGEVTVVSATWTEMVLKLRELEGDKNLSLVPDYFNLGKNRYVPLTSEGKADQSEKRCELALEQSNKKPQPVGEVSGFNTASNEVNINSTLLNRLWLYNGKLYLTTRNDYNTEQVHLLILELLDKEGKKFKDLKARFKNKLS